MRYKLLVSSLVLSLLLGAVSWVWAAGPAGIAAFMPNPQGTPESAASSGVEPARLPPGAVGPGIYIQFDEPTHNLDPAHGYPVAGGHSRYGWDILERNFDDDYRFDEFILPWVQQEANRGKKVAIGFTTYNGRGADGGITVPSWLWARDPNVRFNNSGWYLLNYLNRTYVTEYKEFIEAFARWVGGNATVRNALAWVEIGTGQWGENQPARKYGSDNVDWTYYANTATGGSVPAGGWSDVDWRNHCNEISDIYRNAFNRPAVGMNSLPIFTNIAPTFRSAWERDLISDHGAVIGVGLKHAGLLPDHNNAAESYRPILNYWDSATYYVPISWEVYGEAWFQTETSWYWTVLCGLDKHPDNFLATRDLVTNPAFLPSTRIAAEYCGVSIDTTPGVWVALRETFRFPIASDPIRKWDKPEPGNFDFWLYQDDYTGGRTVTETNTYNDITKDVKNRLNQPIYNSNLGSAKEGWTTRRTNQGDSNPYMWFKIDDRYIYGNAQATIKVIYFDIGADKWSLRYDSTAGEKDAIPDGSANAWVQKGDSRTWKTATFTITDGRFRNNMAGAHDFRIDCRNDGDEWIHLVEVRKPGGANPTPTPTLWPTPSPTPSPTPTTNPTGVVQVQLRTGANMVGYGGPRKSVTEALASINGLYTKIFAYVWEYNSSQGQYQLVLKRYFIDNPNPPFSTLTHFEPGQGYWLYVTQDCVWTWEK